MLGQISGPSVGCVLKLGYRRPLDDSAFLGEIQWDEISEPGEEGSNNTGGKKGQNKRKGKLMLLSLLLQLKFAYSLGKNSHKNTPEDPVAKTHNKNSSFSKVKGKMLR